MEKFRCMLVTGDHPDNWDYAILNIEMSGFNDIPSLTLADSNEKITIGQSIVLLGFQFDSINLSIHSGIISSRNLINQVKSIQVDASVNQGNSGGPLINCETGNVIGIVARKATGLNDQFNKLTQSFIANIDNSNKYLAESNNKRDVIGMNMHLALRITQKQLYNIAQQMMRSANVGIGYVFELDQLKKALKELKY